MIIAGAGKANGLRKANFRREGKPGRGEAVPQMAVSRLVLSRNLHDPVFGQKNYTH